MSRVLDAVRGATWTMVAGVSARGLGLVGTLLLVRYLRPEDYGVVSAASVVVMSANQISTLGIGVYLIAHPRAGLDAARHATALHLGLGALAFAAVLVLADPLGRWLDAPTLRRYVPGLLAAALFDRLAYVPERILMRELRFRRVGVSRTVGELAYTVVSCGAAVLGWGGFAVVVGNVARSLLRSALLVGATDRREWLAWMPLRARALREIGGYGLTVSVGGTAGFASRRWDNLLVSRFYGPSVMGAYNIAYNLADVPAVQVGEQITDVLFASLANMPAEARLAALLRALRLVALLLFPLAIGLGAIAPTVGETFFDRRWSDVGPMLMVLSVLSIPRPIGLALSGYLQAQRRARTVMGLEILQLALLLGAMITVGRLGPLWTCAAVGVSFSARTFVSMLLVRRLEGVPLRRFLDPLVPPLLACAPMVASILAARHALAWLGAGPAGVRLLVELTVGALVYVGAALLLAGTASRDLIGLLRGAHAAPPAPHGST